MKTNLKRRERYYMLKLIFLDRNRPKESTPKIQQAFLRRRAKTISKLTLIQNLLAEK